MNIFKQHSGNTQPLLVTVTQGHIYSAPIYDIENEFSAANRISSPPMINTVMEYSFTSWERRRHLAPDSERILPMVVAAGTAGMTRKQLGNVIELDREVMDELLAGMVQIGLLTVVWREGLPVYRAGVSGI
jgi:hypothetical protein